MVLCATVGVSLIVSGSIAMLMSLFIPMSVDTVAWMAVLVIIGIALMALSYRFYEDIKRYKLIKLHL